MIESCQRRSKRSAVWRTSAGTGLHLREGRDIASGLQGPVEDLLHGHHRMEGHLLSDVIAINASSDIVMGEIDR